MRGRRADATPLCGGRSWDARQLCKTVRNYLYRCNAFFTARVGCWCMRLMFDVSMSIVRSALIWDQIVYCKINVQYELEVCMDI